MTFCADLQILLSTSALLFFDDTLKDEKVVKLKNFIKFVSNQTNYFRSLTQLFKLIGKYYRDLKKSDIRFYLSQSWILLLVLFSCTSQQDSSENLLLLSKFNSLDSLFYTAKSEAVTEVLREAKSEIKKTDVEKLAYYYYYAGMLAQADLGKMNSYADTALRLFSSAKAQKKYPQAYIKVLLLKSEVYLKFKRYNEALEYYFVIKSLGDKDEDPIGYAHYYSQIAEILFAQHRYQQAAGYYFQSFKILDEAEDASVNNIFYLKQGALNNSSFSYENAAC